MNITPIVLFSLNNVNAQDDCLLNGVCVYLFVELKPRAWYKYTTNYNAVDLSGVCVRACHHTIALIGPVCSKLTFYFAWTVPMLYDLLTIDINALFVECDNITECHKVEEEWPMPIHLFDTIEPRCKHCCVYFSNWIECNISKSHVPPYEHWTVTKQWPKYHFSGSWYRTYSKHTNKWK